MQKTDHREKRKTILWLLMIYAGSVIIRYLLALVTRHYPTVSIDEFLYYSLGRSIATEGSLLYLGQPATYNYIVYPLILSPVYLLFGHGTDFFRIIQLWNIILMSLSVFPFYGLCNAMIGKRKTALWITGLFMLLPCFILGEYIYSEAIIYPLFYTLMYCVYRYLKENSIRYTVWIGILGALLYYSKPGAVLPAVLALVFFGGKAVAGKTGKAGINVLAGLGCLAVGFFAIKLLAEQVFGYQGTLLSVYNDQVIQSKDYNIEYFFNAAVKYPYYFVLAGGVFPFLVSLWNYPEYNRENKQYYVFQIICALLTMIGTAWVVNRPERKELLYLRYVEMYLPILLAYCVMPKEEHLELSDRSRQTVRILSYVLLGYVTVCTVVWGCSTGVEKTIEPHFLISLSVLYTNHITGIGNILIVFLTGMTLYLLARSTDKHTLLKVCCIVLITMTALNNIRGYVTTADNTDSMLAEETTEIHRIIGDKEYIHIYTEDQCDYGLDVNSRYNISRIIGSDFIRNIQQNQGIYVPFIPSTVRGMTGTYETPDTDMLIVDEKVYSRIQFSRNTSNFISADRSFNVVSFIRGDQIVDCVMDSKSYPKVDTATPCTLRVFNDEMRRGSVRICMEIESQAAQNMDITAGDYHNTIPLSAGRNWYEIEITESAAEYSISVWNDEIEICSYEITTEG